MIFLQRICMSIKLPYYTRKDRIIIAAMLPPVILVINYWIFGWRYFAEGSLFLWSSIISGVTGIVSWQVQIMIALWLQKKYPKYHQTLRRVFYALLLYILVTSLTILFVFLGYAAVPYFKYDLEVSHLILALVTGIVVDVLSASFHEGVAFYEKWKKVTDEAEALKRENLQTQLESLKAQVNPHFLFNSLNSLSSLISEDPPKAEKFLNEMCKVYRYLLRNNEEDLATLSSEMQFIQSYFHLLKTRYGDSLQLQTKIDAAYLCHQLPSLTLQMLVENAVKHNIMMKEQPLKINISTNQEGKLIVANTLQRKVREVTSNKIGLGNIVNKYRLLRQDDILVKEDEKEFSVIIPLIQSEN